MLKCWNNQLTSLNTSNCTALTELECWSNDLTSLNISNCTALTFLDCNNNGLQTLDVSSCTALISLDCPQNNLTILDVSYNTALSRLNCWNNQLTSLDISGCFALTRLNCDRNQLTSLDASACIALNSLSCERNNLKTLDISKCTSLTQLDCEYNDLVALNVSPNTDLTFIDCNSNDLTALDLGNNTKLTTIKVGSQKTTNSALNLTNDSQYPYKFDLNELVLDTRRISNLTANVYTSHDNDIVYFSGKPSRMGYRYDTIPLSSSSDKYMSVTVTFDVASESSVDSITITSPDSKVINLPASGGTFDNVIVTITGNISNDTPFGLGLDGEIIDNPSSETNIGEIIEINSYTPTDDKRIVYIKGKAAPNYSGTQTTTRITVSFNNNGVTYSTSFDIVVATALKASGYNTREWRYKFSMPTQLASTIASVFGVDSSQIFQLSDSEILDENWALEAGDSSSISNMGETVAINMPSVMPSNTGVYVMQYALDSSLAGKSLKVRGVTASNPVSSSAIEDREYVFFDENYNEITSVPANGIVYVAQRMTSGHANRGVITTSDELSVGLITPIEEASRDILREKISELKDVKTEEVLFIEEKNIYPAQEPPAIVVEQSKNDNANILAKFNTLSVDISGLYVFHVILSDDIAKEIESVDIDKLRIYAAEFESADVFPAVYQASDGQVKTAFLYGLLNTFELLTMGGEKLKFGAKEFLMVGVLNASKPLSLYIGKILLALLMGGCNTGFGVAVLALVVGGVFILRKNKKRSLS